MQPLVSVIMPLYNAEKYVGEAIQSVINQTFTQWELIIVNDGSTDKSLEVAKQFESNQIKVFSKHNEGASAARNFGLRVAKGEYVQFLDADDLLSENKIEEQVNILKGSQNRLAICNCVNFFDGQNHIKEGTYRDESSFIFSTDNPIYFLINLYGGFGEGWMVAIHAWLTPMSLLLKAGYWDENLTVDDDGEFFCRVLIESEGVVFVKNVNCFYRKYKQLQSLSYMKNEKGYVSLLNALIRKDICLNEKLEHLQFYNLEMALKKSLARNYFNIAVLSFPSTPFVYKTALRRVKELGNTTYKPLIGGKLLQFISDNISWRLARYISYYYLLFCK